MLIEKPEICEEVFVNIDNLVGDRTVEVDLMDIEESQEDLQLEKVLDDLDESDLFKGLMQGNQKVDLYQEFTPDFPLIFFDSISEDSTKEKKIDCQRELELIQHYFVQNEEKLEGLPVVVCDKDDREILVGCLTLETLFIKMQLILKTWLEKGLRCVLVLSPTECLEVNGDIYNDAYTSNFLNLFTQSEYNEEQWDKYISELEDICEQDEVYRKKG